MKPNDHVKVHCLLSIGFFLGEANKRSAIIQKYYQVVSGIEPELPEATVRI